MKLHGAHLVGSVPLRDAESVFRTVAGTLGPHLLRMPDGETGPRKDWIAWQYGVLATTPGLVPVSRVGDRGYLRRQLVCLSGERSTPRFGPLGYASAALASYGTFERLQRSGAIPKHMRFQVSLPTPLAPLTVFCDLEDRALVEPAYEGALLGELEQITAAIPHDKLAIQWDVAVEIALLEGMFPAHFASVERGVAERLARLGTVVPRDVTLGYHLCYGDFGHRHFTQPANASVLARLAGTVVAQPRRPAYLHMPVPLAWTTPIAFAPLATLPIGPEIYLGLVHLADGLAGARTRIALASQFVPRFGIATECGWGRRPMDSVQPLLDLHAAVLASG